MNLKRKAGSGFTLVELVVVVFIIFTASALGIMSLLPRVKISRIDDAARSMMADLTFARSIATLKGCPARFILCEDAVCGTLATASASNMISNVTHYGILRMSQVDAGPCQNSNAVPTDGFADWDFEKRPQSIPTGVSFTAIYTGANSTIYSDDWDDSSSGEASNSLWFNTFGVMNFPVVGTTSGGARIAYQLQSDDCDASDEDCIGFFVTMTNGGVTDVLRCLPGTRVGAASDICF